MITIGALLHGEIPPWPSLSMSIDRFLSLCDEQEITALVYHRLATATHQWPAELCEPLAARARFSAARELILGREITAVADALAASGVHPILLKGVALGYTAYPFPACRPRSDTDLILREDEVELARAIMKDRGYSMTVQCSELFHQFEVTKDDPLGVTHVFDIHWRISTQPVFASVLTYDELRAHAQPVPALGLNAFAPSAVDSLLLACIHPVMHHQNQGLTLWMCDIHLLASVMSEADWDECASKATAKGVAAICAHSLARTRQLFESQIPDRVVDTLVAQGNDERSAEFLQPNRGWRHELESGVRSLPTWRERGRLLRHVFFPAASYMRSAYRVNDTTIGNLLLPALYVHRNVFGAWKLIAGRK